MTEQVAIRLRACHYRETLYGEWAHDTTSMYCSVVPTPDVHTLQAQCQVASKGRKERTEMSNMMSARKPDREEHRQQQGYSTSPVDPLDVFHLQLFR